MIVGLTVCNGSNPAGLTGSRTAEFGQKLAERPG
jgi:hypothetical protein